MVGGVTAAWPLGVRAQPPRMRVGGFIHTTVWAEELKRAFFQGLSGAGYIEGQNIAMQTILIFQTAATKSPRSQSAMACQRSIPFVILPALAD